MRHPLSRCVMLRDAQPAGVMPALFTSRKDVVRHVQETCAYSLRLFLWRVARERVVETLKEKYIRKGKVRSLQLDFDALEMLQELSPTRKGYGRYLSELVRRDYIRREEWKRVRALEQAALVEVGDV